jgi:hypothetical protein
MSESNGDRFNDPKFGRLGYKCGWERCRFEAYGQMARTELHQHLEAEHGVRREHKPAGSRRV